MKQLLAAQMMQHSLWLGGAAGSGMQGYHNPMRGWDGTILGRLHIWMAEMHLELEGGDRVPMGRQQDLLLVELAENEEEEAVLAQGAWVADAWRVSGYVRWDGSMAAALGQQV